jgi:ABC-type transport system involved in multi-copper enzyme maturation permease subunit
MITHIARKELLDHLLSLRFHISMAVMLALTGLSGYTMYHDYRLRMENYSVLKERSRPRPGEAGVMAVVEPSPLSVFAKGLDEAMTRGYTVTAYLGIEPHSRQAQAFWALLFAPPDLLYIVKAVLALVALLLAYDTVSGERENGTLKLVLSSGVSRGQFVAGKMLGGLAALLLPFLLMLAAVLLGLASRPGIALKGAEFARLGLMAASAAVYLALFYALGMLASVVARSSASSLVILLSLWATIVFAVPSLGNLAAGLLKPLPSPWTQEAQRIQAFAKNRFLVIQSEHGDSSAAGLSASAFNRDYDRLVEEYRSQLDSTLDLSKTISRLSPAATLSFLFTDLAGTGLAEQRRLTRALLDFKTRNLAALSYQGGTSGPSPEVFAFQRTGLAAALGGGAALDFAILALSWALLFAASTVAFLRMDVR